MSSVKYPTSDTKRLTLLTQFTIQAQKDDENGQHLLNKRTLRDIERSIEKLSSALASVEQHKRQRSAYVRASTKNFDRLRKVIEAIWDELRYQVRRQDLDSSILTHFGLNRQGSLPRVTSRNDLLTIATKMLTGNDEAMASGYSGIDKFERLQEAYEIAYAGHSALSAHKRMVADVQADLATRRKLCDETCRVVVAQLRAALHLEMPAYQRNIMRAYGVQFQKQDGGQRVEKAKSLSKAHRAKSGSAESTGSEERGAEAVNSEKEIASVMSTPLMSKTGNSVQPEVNGHAKEEWR